MSGRPSIAYRHGVDVELRHGRWVDRWEISAVDVSGRIEHQSCILSSPEGRLDIVYTDGARQSVKHAYSDEGFWNVRIVDRPAWVGAFVAAGGEAPNDLHLTYRDHRNGSLRHGTHADSMWITETVAADVPLDGAAPIAVDPSGRTHVVYCRTTSKDLRHAWHDGVTWASGAIALDATVGGEPSLAIDNEGTLHLGVRVGSSDGSYAVLHLRSEGNSWHEEVAANGEALGPFVSLALDPHGLPCVAYWDFVSAMVKLARFDGVSWGAMALDVGFPTNEYCALVVDAWGLPHVALADEHKNQLCYAYFDGSSWRVDTIERMPAGAYLSDCWSLTIDDEGNPHLSYSDTDRGALKHAYLRSPPHASGAAITLRVEGRMPARGSVPLLISLAAQGKVGLSVYDLAGREINSVRRGVMVPGYHHLVWDGLDEAGRSVPNGAYVISATSGGTHAAIPIIIIREED